MITLLNKIELFIAVGTFLSAFLIYAFVPWWKTWAGRVVFTLLGSMALILTFVILGVMLGDYPGKRFARDITYGLLCLSGTVLLVSIVTIQLSAGRRKRRDLRVPITRHPDDNA